ncbi:MAG: hypothetical protein AAFP70_06200 [Calditrichota bacterium]
MAITKHLSVKITLRLLISGLTVLILAQFASCSGDGSTNVEPENFPESDLSWNLHIRPILQDNCAVPGCHDSGTKQNGLDLQQDPPTFQSNTRLVVVPFSRTTSFLYALLFTETDGIQRMPKDRGALSDAKVNAIGTWIDEGANTAN